MIPKILHYCFGMSPDFGGKPWSLVHHVCVKSAIERIKPDAAFFYCEFEPGGPWWELTRGMLTVRKIQAPRSVFGNPLSHPAHRADIIRLEQLLATGGIYLDTDVFVHRNFDDLLDHSAVLASQRGADGAIRGLCNAVILAEPHAPFLQKWYSEYQSFRSSGPGDRWDEHSVEVPYRLYHQFPVEVSLLPDTAFFSPTFLQSELEKIFAPSQPPLDLSVRYANHLWETSAWIKYLEHLTPRRVRSSDTNFHRWARPLIEDLPDDYGAPSISDRVARNIRRARNRFERTRKDLQSAFQQAPQP